MSDTLTCPVCGKTFIHLKPSAPLTHHPTYHTVEVPKNPPVILEDVQIHGRYLWRD